MVKRLAIALGIATYNLLQNNGALAGQTVFHAHVHLIPKPDIESGLKVDRTRPRSVDQAGLISELRARLERGDVSSAS
jgi:diadenosine tetraphosphate (Ap4A) HIT family hydrolase